MAVDDPILSARIAVQLASAAIVSADFVRAVELLRNAIVPLRSAGEPQYLTDAVLRLAFAENKLGREEDAAATLTDAVALARSAGDSRREIFALDDLGGIAYGRKDYLAAGHWWREGFDISKRAHNREYRAKFAFFLSIARRNLGDDREALALVAESRDIYRDLGLLDLQDRSAEYLRKWQHVGETRD